LRASSATTAVGIRQAAIDDDVATGKPGNLVQPGQDAMWQSAYPGGCVVPATY
jgi:malate dehydrogenase (oxaloacetate-decarboxylating)